MRGWAAAGGCAAILWMGIAATATGAEKTTAVPDAKRAPDTIVFADIPWLTPANHVVELLAARGYPETPGTRNKDRVTASGRLFDHYAILQARLDDQGRLSRWEISIPTKNELEEYEIQRKVYDDAVTELQSKYAVRHEIVDHYRFPYEKDDGKTARGIRGGEVTILSRWDSRKGDRLTLEIDRSMAVAFTYDSRYWRKVEEERRKKKAKDL
jgi:hypothetical protein